MRRKLLILLTVLVVAGVGFGGFRYLDSRGDDDPAPATKRALAAVAVDVLDISPSSYNVNPMWDVAEPLGVEIRWHPDGDHDAHYLHIDVRQGMAIKDVDGCNPYSECTDWKVGGGTMYLSWQDEEPEEDPGILVLTYLTTDGEARTVVYAGQEINGDPRKADDLPISVEKFEDLLEDPRFSTTTTKGMVETDLKKWPKDGTAGDPVPTTPAVIAQWMVQDGVAEPKGKGVPADVSSYGDGAVGAAFHSPDRVSTVVLVPKDDPAAPTCGPGWHCQTKRGVTTGWKQGVAMVIRESDDAIVYSTVRSAAIDRLPRPAWKFKQTGWDFESMRRSYAAMNLQTTEEFARGSDLSWFRD